MRIDLLTLSLRFGVDPVDGDYVNGHLFPFVVVVLGDRSPLQQVAAPI